MESFRIYTRVNLADTSRDPDEIIIKTLAYKKKFISAVRFAYKYMEDNFSKPNLSSFSGYKLRKKGSMWTEYEIASWGEEIIIEKIELDE